MARDRICQPGKSQPFVERAPRARSYTGTLHIGHCSAHNVLYPPIDSAYWQFVGSVASRTSSSRVRVALCLTRGVIAGSSRLLQEERATVWPPLCLCCRIDRSADHIKDLVLCAHDGTSIKETRISCRPCSRRRGQFYHRRAGARAQPPLPRAAHGLFGLLPDAGTCAGMERYVRLWRAGAR